MAIQRVPSIEADFFVLGEISDLFKDNEIKINSEYQRSEIWKPKQKIGLIESIINGYSIGVLVLFKNSQGQHEILDGQQRLLTIKKYVEGNLNLKNSVITKYSELSKQEKITLDAYPIHYLEIKGFSKRTKEEDITQTFIRLQEGTPLNKAEKINAYRGKFKDTFRELRDTNPFFESLSRDKRFKWRLLAASILLLELESDFENKIFPGLTIDDFIDALKKYKENITVRTIKTVKANLNFLNHSLNVLFSALQLRDLVPFYLLVSCLRKEKADNSNFMNEFAAFAEDFLKTINSFSVYDSIPPNGLDQDLFIEYKKYKEEGRKATTKDSIKYRFDFIHKQFSTRFPYIKKDVNGLHTYEQKRILYFRQRGICPECNQKFRFDGSTSHHIIAHSKGGLTEDLRNAVLLHEKCHQKLEERLLMKKIIDEN